MKNNQPYISIKIVPNSGKEISVASWKRRRINHFIEANNFSDCVVKVSVKYGPGAFNKGLYKTKEDFILALEAFLEPGS